jgi:hypothetical protein
VGVRGDPKEKTKKNNTRKKGNNENAMLSVLPSRVIVEKVGRERERERESSACI